MEKMHSQSSILKLKGAQQPVYSYISMGTKLHPTAFSNSQASALNAGVPTAPCLPESNCSCLACVRSRGLSASRSKQNSSD